MSTNDKCVWSQMDGDSFTYDTQCGHCFDLTGDEHITDTDLKFCAFCGKKIVEEPYEYYGGEYDCA